MGQYSSKSDSDKTTGSSRPVLSRSKASILLYLIATVVIGLLVGTVLNGLNRLPPYVATIAGSFGVVIALFSGLLGIILERSFPKGIWQNANRRFAITASILTVVLLTVSILAIPPSSPLTTKNMVTPTPTHTATQTPTSSPTPTPTPTPSPTATPVPIVSSSTGTIRGTFFFSFDHGIQVTSGGDVWWDQQTDTVRSMNPLGNAKLINLGIVDFNSITPTQLQSYTYITTPIDGNNDPSNQLVTGDVFAVTTNGGNYAKVLVVMYGYNLQIQWVTYQG